MSARPAGNLPPSAQPPILGIKAELAIADAYCPSATRCPVDAERSTAVEINVDCVNLDARHEAPGIIETDHHH